MSTLAMSISLLSSATSMWQSESTTVQAGGNRQAGRIERDSPRLALSNDLPCPACSRSGPSVRHVRPEPTGCEPGPANPAACTSRPIAGQPLPASLPQRQHVELRGPQEHARPPSAPLLGAEPARGRTDAPRPFASAALNDAGKLARGPACTLVSPPSIEHSPPCADLASSST